jgi:hypothetical protein
VPLVSPAPHPGNLPRNMGCLDRFMVEEQTAIPRAESRGVVKQTHVACCYTVQRLLVQGGSL